MIVFTFLIFIALFAIQVLCYMKEDSQIRALQKEEKITQIPMFTSGSKLNAFTIEESRIVEASVVVGMNMLRRIWLFLISFFYRPSYPYKWLHDFGYRLAVARLQGKAKDENYFVNFQPSFTNLPHGKLAVHLTATSIKLYKDTLGIYHLPAEAKVIKKFLKRKTVLRRLFETLFLTFCAFLVSIYFFINAASNIIDNLSMHDEEVLWSYLSTSSYLEVKNGNNYLIDAELKLNYILSSLPSSNELKKYPFYIIVADDNDTAMYLLPAGRIVMTKGLIAMISSKQEAEFMMADAIAHYELRHHLHNLSYDIITPYYAIKVFGEESFIARWIVRSSSFYKTKFNVVEEAKANELALAIMNKAYGHGLNIGLFNENILTEESSYINKHPISKDKLFALTRQLNLTEVEPVPLDVDLSPPSIQLVEAHQTAEQLGEFEKVMRDMDKGLNALYNTYNAGLSNLNDLLEPKSLMSDEYLNYKKQMIDYGYDVIDYYKNDLQQTIQELNAKAAKAYYAEVDKEKAAYNRAVYNKAVEKFVKMMNYSFERDAEVLKNQLNVLNFLSKRLGSYKLGGSGLVFSTPNDQQSYEELLSRIYFLKNQKPEENY